MGQVYTRRPKAEGKKYFFKLPIGIGPHVDLVMIIKNIKTQRDKEITLVSEIGEATFSCIRYSALRRSKA